jgi:hypothetical protein
MTVGKPVLALAAAIAIFASVQGFAQAPSAAQRQAAAAAQQAAAEGDHQAMMDQLGISALRPPVSNDVGKPGSANYDEAQAGGKDLEDPLRLDNGDAVSTAAQWRDLRRPQLIELYDREIYGRVPATAPRVTWRVKNETREMKFNTPIVMRRLEGVVDSSAYLEAATTIDLRVATPANATGPVPVILSLGFAENTSFPGAPPPRPDDGTDWMSQVLARGWGYAVVVPPSIQPDTGAGFGKGVIGISLRGQPRKPDDWGVLRAWAWGASRALDYLETDTRVDARRVGLEGMSRYGKAALVAMAYDPRFAIGLIDSSGMGGASLMRRRYGEQLENATGTGAYHWYAGNLLKYSGPLSRAELPVDAHELIALVAPRPLFIGAGRADQPGDGWVDPKGQFMAAAAASPVYRLLGAKGLSGSEFPPINTLLGAGDIAWRQHDQGHSNVPNWPYFLGFAQRYLADQ